MTMSNNTATTVAFVFSCMEENNRDMVLVCPQCCKHIVIDPTNLDQYHDGKAHCYWCKFAAPVEGDVSVDMFDAPLSYQDIYDVVDDVQECLGCGQLYTAEELSNYVCDVYDYDMDDIDGFKAECDVPNFRDNLKGEELWNSHNDHIDWLDERNVVKKEQDKCFDCNYRPQTSQMCYAPGGNCIYPVDNVISKEFDGMTQTQILWFAEKCEEIMDLQTEVETLTVELNGYKDLAKKYRQMMDDIECPF